MTDTEPRTHAPVDLPGPISWAGAHAHLLDVVNDHISGGSLAIAEFTKTVMSIYRRYVRGERTQELYDEIMKLRKFG